MRQKLTIRNFAQGDIIKGEHVGQQSVIHMSGFKFGPKLEVLTTRGGWDDWSPAGLANILGIKRWYREDGGRTFITFNGGDSTVYGFRFSDLVNSPNLGLYSEIYDKESVVLFENCGSVLVIMPLGPGRPYSIRIDKHTDPEQIQGKLLGLDPPNVSLSYIEGAITRGTNQEPGTKGLDRGEYIYCLTYCYGTRDNPEKWGESAPGPTIADNFKVVVLGENGGIIQINGFTPITVGGLVQKIRVYRTLKDTTDPFYLVGEITTPNITSFNDTLHDSLVDLSKVLPTQTGLPYGMRAAIWHPTLKRLFWWGEDGYLHFGAAGYPDVHPPENILEVGSIGYKGNGFAIIRNNLYGFKEDGVFLISGSAPNYVGNQINEVGAFARGSVAQAANGLVFYVGKEGDKCQVYRFDGNVVDTVGDAIIEAMPYAKNSILNKIVGKIIGNEYWLSLITSDPRFFIPGAYFNNLILAYNFERGRWTDFPSQAGSLEWLDGPGDSGEIYQSESDPTAGRGNIFKWNDVGFYYNQTTYGVAEFYTKQRLMPRSILLGNLVSDTRDLQDLSILECDIVVRGYSKADPILNVFSDNRFNDDSIQTGIVPEVDKELLKVNDANKFGNAASAYGTSIFEPVYTTRRHFNIKDVFGRTGVAVELSFPPTLVGRTIEIEAMEVVIEPTDGE